jgi:hypothetical protein
MTNYRFETTEFGISDTGVHLLRNGYNYKTIDFSQINRIRIENGKELHNWGLILAIGATLIVAGIYLSIGTISVLAKGDIKPVHAKIVFLLFIPAAGAYFVYNSLQTGLLLKFDYSNGSKGMLPLRELIKTQKLSSLKTFLSEKLGSRSQIVL